MSSVALLVFAEVNTLVLSNQTKDSPGFEIRHRCNGNKRKWANQEGQNEPPDSSYTFVPTSNGADKANNYRRRQPPKKKEPSHQQSFTAP